MTDETPDPIAELVSEIVEELSLEAFADACGSSFETITRCSIQEVDYFRIIADASTFTGTADSWTIDAYLSIDTDCGRSDYTGRLTVRITGRLTLGRTHYDSIHAV